MELFDEKIMYFLMLLTCAYLLVSIVIEALSILFLLTPTKKDDKFIKAAKEKWEKGKKYIDWFSIRTPLTKALKKILGALTIAKEDLQKYLEKRREKKAKGKKT